MSGATELVAVARQEIGTVEAPAGSNHTKYGAWYGIQDAWCGMFVSWCADRSGNADVIPKFAYTPSGAAWFQQRGRFSRQPLAGSIAFYDVSGQGRISHCGIVESVNSDGTWNAIEGNTNAAGSRTGGEVRRQRRSTVGTSRGGFGHPSWATQPASGAPLVNRPTLRRGSFGAAVTLLQGALSSSLTAAKLPAIQCDGSFGPATQAAVIWFQRLHQLTPDGIVGPLTWSRLIH